jgi:hypothetical protein
MDFSHSGASGGSTSPDAFGDSDIAANLAMLSLASQSG